jgi:ribosomal protein S18 acetylase RimI-like enzyme
MLELTITIMIKAGKIHKDRVLELLAECIDKNKSVNWIVKQDAKRKERIRHLLNYSFEICIAAEQIFLTEDQNGVIICSMSDDKLPFLEEAWHTARFLINVTGINGIGKALRRERYVTSFHPTDHEFIYIWFLAVDKSMQGTGVGTAMLAELITTSNQANLPIYLETSEERNVKFYQKHGFEIYHVSDEAMFGFKLYFLRKLPVL